MLNWIRLPKFLSLVYLLTLSAAVTVSCSSNAPSPSSQPSSQTSSAAKTEIAEGFPLKAGTYWVYTGTVKWQDGLDSRETSVTWRMEVVRTEYVGRYEVSILEGHPSDLAWFTPGKPRGGHIFVRDGDKYYEIASIQDLGELFTNEAKLEPHLNFESLFLELPLQPGVCLGQDPDHKRDDNMYCWSVGVPKPVTLDGVKGVSAGRNYLEYELAFRSLPDHTIIHFVPGVGITSYLYGHHGSVSEADVHLVQYHPG
jgi:hypothetical protein